MQNVDKQLSKAGWMSAVHNNVNTGNLFMLSTDCKILNELHASTRDSRAAVDVLRVSDQGICQLCFVSSLPLSLHFADQ